MAVLEALQRVGRWCSEELASHYEGSKSELSESDIREIRDACAEIDKATDLGSLFMSDEAAACLNRLEHDMEQTIPKIQEDFVGYISTIEKAAVDGLKTLRAIAKRDLHVGSGKWWSALGQVVKRLRGH